MTPPMTRLRGEIEEHGENATGPGNPRDLVPPSFEQGEPRGAEEQVAAPAAPASLDGYESIVGSADLEELRLLAREVKGKTIKMVNSTAVGGGVAEMLNRLVPLLGELEVATRWDVITGGNDFFEITKAFHNALHGAEYQLTQSAKEIFLSYNEQNRQRMSFTEDLVVIHDPQPVPLIRPRGNSPAHWVWRCHIDLSNPNPQVWAFLQPFVEQYDAAIFSSQRFSRQLPIPQFLFYPCIDPLSEKNKTLDDGVVQKVCDEFHIDRARPIVTQVSRFDRLKDPVGVIRAFKLARKYVDCQLVLAGGGASDDPEGAAVLKEAQEAAGGDRGHLYSRAFAMVRSRDQRLANGFNGCGTEISPRGLRAHSHRGLMEGETHHCKRRRRHSKSNHPQADWNACPLRGRLRLPDPLFADPSRIRCPTRTQWSGARQRKLPHHDQSASLVTPASYSHKQGENRRRTVTLSRRMHHEFCCSQAVPCAVVDAENVVKPTNAGRNGWLRREIVVRVRGDVALVGIGFCFVHIPNADDRSLYRYAKYAIVHAKYASTLRAYLQLRSCRFFEWELRRNWATVKGPLVRKVRLLSNLSKNENENVCPT